LNIENKIEKLKNDLTNDYDNIPSVIDEIITDNNEANNNIVKPGNNNVYDNLINKQKLKNANTYKYKKIKNYKNINKENNINNNLF
jgi:hypothetical protein